MKRVAFARLAALLLMIGVGDALASQTSVPFFECRNCNDAQMQQAALAHTGLDVRIVYNLASAHIFKYNVYMEPGCLNGPISGAASQADSTASGCSNNPTRQIEWMPVDSGLQAPFNAMVSLHQSNPTLLDTTKVSLPISDVGYNPQSPPDSFNPRQVAYDRYTGSTFRNFSIAALAYINNASVVYGTNPDVASLLFDIWAPLRNLTINISVPPGVSLNLQTLHTDLTVDFTAPDGSYVEVEFTYSNNSYHETFVAAVDSTGVLLPTYEDVHAPGFNRRFYGPGGGLNGNEMGNFLHTFGGFSFIGNNSCQRYILTCLSDPLHPEFNSCRLDCSP